MAQGAAEQLLIRSPMPEATQLDPDGIDPLDPEHQAVALPITDQLDLHCFRPSDLGALLPEYLLECQKAGILRVRVIHGKGTGSLRIGVHRLLDRQSIVRQWTWPAPGDNWGATWVDLSPASTTILAP
jgi:DNA-nicking Smr family endonuclease